MRPALLLVATLLAALAPAAEPLRVFIRSGPKSHGPGCHDHPAFLRDWTPLLQGMGARVEGGEKPPTEEQLARTDVVVIHRQCGADMDDGERGRLEAFAKRGGGIVVIHAGIAANHPAGLDSVKDLVGGVWRPKVTRWREGPMELAIATHGHPLGKGVADFGMDDEIYYDLDLRPDIQVVATAPTPRRKGDGFEWQPQVWAYEKSGAQRAFVFVPGHRYANFARDDVRELLIRGIAWAGRREADFPSRPR